MRKANYFAPKELEIFSLEDPIFNTDQMRVINRKTPKAEIEIKTDEHGFKYKSVKAAYVKALVTMVTGGNFHFQIKSREFIPSTREVIVEGRLTINGTSTFSREQFGAHHVGSKAEQQGNKTVDRVSNMGNAYKAAASDAFKKCASEFGFCWDIYGQDRPDKNKEQPKLNHDQKKKLERLEHFLKEAGTAEELQSAYTIHLDSDAETPQSKTLLITHMKRLGFHEAAELL